MSHHGPQLDQTTQTDLLYGLSAKGAAATTGSVTLEPAVTLSRGLDELQLEEFNAPSDIVTQNAATRADGLLLGHADGLGESASGIRKASRWRFADGIAPRPYTSNDQPPGIGLVEPRRRRSYWQVLLAQGWAGSVGWLTSFCIHAVALPLLLVLTVPEVSRHWGTFVEGSQIAQRELLEVSAPTEVAALPVEVEIISPQPVAMEVSLPEHWTEPGAAPGWMAFQAILTSTAGDNPVDEVQGLFGNQGAGKSSTGEERGAAEFFGAQAAGNKFVFVVDCSNSMEERNRWTHACQELVASIDRLSPDQLFYIVFFDGTVHRMFNHEERDAALFPATLENKARVAAWLATARLGPETRPFLAMKCAFELQPDAIFLLTDGDFSDPTAEYLKQLNRPVDAKRQPRHQVAVHTINFHNRSLASQAMLKRIARENAGRYTFVAPK